MSRLCGLVTSALPRGDVWTEWQSNLRSAGRAPAEIRGIARHTHHGDRCVCSRHDCVCHPNFPLRPNCCLCDPNRCVCAVRVASTQTTVAVAASGFASATDNVSTCAQGSSLLPRRTCGPERFRCKLPFVAGASTTISMQLESLRGQFPIGVRTRPRWESRGATCAGQSSSTLRHNSRLLSQVGRAR
jgi:hypothetical protein